MTAPPTPTPTPILLPARPLILTASWPCRSPQSSATPSEASPCGHSKHQCVGLHGDVQQGGAPGAGAAGERGGERGGGGARGGGAGVQDGDADGRGAVPARARRRAEGHPVALRARPRRRERGRVRRGEQHQSDRGHQDDAGHVARRRPRRGRHPSTCRSSRTGGGSVSSRRSRRRTSAIAPWRSSNRGWASA